SDEPYSEPDIDPKIQAEIDECIAYADALGAEGIDARVVVKTVAREEVETSARGSIEVKVNRVMHPAVLDDIPEPAQEEGAIEGTYETLGDLMDQGHMIVAMSQQSAVLTERISELERDNTRLRDMTMPNIRSGATMTLEGGGEQEDVNGGGNGNIGANGNGNGGGNGNGNGNGNGGGNGYGNHNMNLRVKYATCTLLNSALTWWNWHKRVIGIEAAYAMTWTKLMKLITEVYCPRNKIQKMEAELWNLTMKGNNLTAYIRRFQELVLLCTRMVPDEEDKVERFIGGLPDNI
ncbi:putative reverse transcriptase domain-containing protein, partial [Tanacetum coccineum]